MRLGNIKDEKLMKYFLRVNDITIFVRRDVDC